MTVERDRRKESANEERPRDPSAGNAFMNAGSSDERDRAQPLERPPTLPLHGAHPLHFHSPSDEDSWEKDRHLAEAVLHNRAGTPAAAAAEPNNWERPGDEFRLSEAQEHPSERRKKEETFKTSPRFMFG